jgi:hypothetical protein
MYIWKLKGREKMLQMTVKHKLWERKGGVVLYLSLDCPPIAYPNIKLHENLFNHS